MADKNKESSGLTERQRQSRKEILRERKQQEQLRTIRIGMIIVVAILATVVLVALVNEYIINPRREVASVGDEIIALREWQDRVRFERAQRIISLEEQLEMVNNDVGMVQQFSGQTILELQNHEAIGEAALNRMAQDEVVFQALAERGITISDEEIDARIEEAFNYYGGESPTPVPTPSATIVPTPSITPIGYEAPGETESLEPIPTSEPFPTPTPVSEAAFQQEFDDLIGKYTELGVDGNIYRSLVASALASERLLEILAEESDLAEEDVHASAFILTFPDKELAEQAVSDIEMTEYLTVWNVINSQEPGENGEESPIAASEIIWQTEDAVANGFGPELATVIFEIELNQPSAIVEVTGADDSSRYFIVMTTGREMRPLSESELRSRKIELFLQYIDEAMITDVEIGEYWRSRVPTLPILDPKFRQPPTPTPPLPEVETAPETGE